LYWDWLDLNILQFSQIPVILSPFSDEFVECLGPGDVFSIADNGPWP